jgi:hypothetical protein
MTAEKILDADPATRTVVINLAAGETATYGGFNFDGFSNGQMRITVPLGWHVFVNCTNSSTTMTNSCAVVDDQPLSPDGTPLAFPGSATIDPYDGLGLHRSGSFTFVASRPGPFRITSLVDGYQADGMWDWLIVSDGGTPSVRT